jgi:hypothetical protein
VERIRAYDRQDLVSGGLVASTGMAFGAGAVLGLPIGSAVRMGPGYFPVVLSGLLTVLGLIIMLRARRRTATAVPPFSWRGFILIPAAVLSFSLLVRPFGLAPALAAATLVTAYSSRAMTLTKAILLAIGLTAFCAVVFKWGLNIAPPLFGRS